MGVCKVPLTTHPEKSLSCFDLGWQIRAFSQSLGNVLCRLEPCGDGFGGGKCSHLHTNFKDRNDMLVALDIETITLPGQGVTQAEIDKFLENYKPRHKKPETIEKHRQEALSKFTTKMNLRAGRVQIVAIGLGRVHPYNCELQDLESLVSEDPQELALFYVNYVEKTMGAKGFLGYNLEGFDLLHVCNLLDQHNLDSLLRAEKWSIIDLCSYPLQRKYKLKDICDSFGIRDEDEELNLMDGGDVQSVWDARNFDLLKSYVELDIVRLSKLYRSLSRIWRLYK